MDERVRFVARLLEGEKMVALCREFAISRKTGYKIFDRYKESGLEALTDRSRRPWRYGNQLPPQVETAIVHLKQEKPYWALAKSVNVCCAAFLVRLRSPPAAPSTPCSIDMVWSDAEDLNGTALRARLCLWDKNPMNYGAPITKASSC
jgi:hypothetical protein